MRPRIVAAPEPNYRGSRATGYVHFATKTMTNRRIGLAVIGVVAVIGYVVWTGRSRSAEDIARSVRQAVVLIEVQGAEEGIGTGFFVADSLVATSLHVVEGATGISVTLEGGQTIDGARVIAYDRERDLALLSTPRLVVEPLGLASDLIEQGADVLVLGHPEGLDFTLSQGIVSAVRELGEAHLLQITAPISPGSSGGPVLDRHGRVVGVATAFLQEGQNLNFAVGAEHLRALLELAVVLASNGDQGETSPPPGIDRPRIIDPGVWEISYSGGELSRGEISLMVDSIAGGHVVGYRHHLPPSLSGSRLERLERLLETRNGSLPRRVPVSGQLTGDPPFRIDMGQSDFWLEVQQITSSRLFSGELFFQTHGRTLSSPYTAAWRRPALTGASRVMFGNSRPGGGPGVHAVGRVTYLAEISWSDLDSDEFIGSVEFVDLEGRGVERGGPQLSEVVFGEVLSEDTVGFHWGEVQCRVPQAQWPGGPGLCWNEQHYYGLQLAPPTGAVDRRFLDNLPAEATDVETAYMLEDGTVALVYWSGPMGTGNPVSTHPGRMWSGTPLSWPEGLSRAYWDWSGKPGRGLAHQPGLGFLFRDPTNGWDTIPVPRDVLPAADDPHVRIAEFADGSFLVLWSVGQCGILSAGLLLEATGERGACRTTAALLQPEVVEWTQVGLPTQFDTLPKWVSAVSLGGSVFFEAEYSSRIESRPHMYIAAPDSIRAVQYPGNDSTNLQARLRSYVSYGGDSLAAVVVWVPVGTAGGVNTPDLTREIVIWKPGENSRVVMTDTEGLLMDAHLIVSSDGRLVYRLEDEARFVDRWDVPINLGFAKTDVELLAVLEDPARGTTHFVSAFGEIQSVATPRELDTVREPEGWTTKVKSWLSDLFQRW